MQRTGRNWLLISLLIFIILESLFFFVPSFFSFFIGHEDFAPPIAYILGSDFLEKNPAITILALGIEYLSVLYLFIYNIKFNTDKIKKILPGIFLGIIIAILSFDIFLIYAITHFELLM